MAVLEDTTSVLSTKNSKVKLSEYESMHNKQHWLKNSNLLGEELGLNELVGARLGLVDEETEEYADVVGT
jgi:hypothetical protein